ncbi:gamma-glutamylcyclotransferase [Bordetella genomosp. 5]|uniref:gamma-glutamylcyclotransferase n=1 Tax=Bordetella genomosp. 5 TaxID=1395608 RepID=UPI000B9DFE5D|nr:gamma-glutamylcyclotransferase [Bordetella genomosp. 5]OZI47740.1 gamma-glutamylcyclotransferase [Bordetella genomosp. 5]
MTFSVGGPAQAQRPKLRQPKSIDCLLQGWNGTDDLWVFAYGSLIWRPGFTWQERRLATVRGYHRSLCLWSRDHRGSPEAPGLVFGLDRGGCCRGVAYRVAGRDVRDTFQMLWQREMTYAAYTPRWLSCHTESGGRDACADSAAHAAPDAVRAGGSAPVRSLVFLLNRGCGDYAGALAEERLLATVRGARGQSGLCLDYVVETERALRTHGIHDCRLADLVKRLSGPAETCAG